MSALPSQIGLTGKSPNPIQPQSQRFISRDPSRLLGSLNAYLYTVSPLNQVDPQGLSPLNPSQTSLVGDAIRFISATQKLSGVKSGVISELNRLFKAGKITSFEHATNLGGYNRVTDNLSVNQGINDYFRRDWNDAFRKAMEADEKGDCALLYRYYNDRNLAIISLAGLLVHEGAHANNKIGWGLNAPDETASFDEEMAFYKGLFDNASSLDKMHYFVPGGLKYRLSALAVAAQRDSIEAPPYVNLNLQIKNPVPIISKAGKRKL